MILGVAKRRQLFSYLMIFVLMPIITFNVGKFIDRVLMLPSFPPTPWNLFAGTGVFYLGLGLGIKSTRSLYKLGGGLPWGEAVEEVRTKRIVTNGVYRYVRNPMVLGYSILPMGMGLLFQSLGMALSITPVVLAVNIVIVKLIEEPDLSERFGENYISYKKATPFLIPDPEIIYREVIRVALKKKSIQIQYASLSIIGLIFLSQILFKESSIGSTLKYQSALFLGSFIIICLIGLIAAVSPRLLKLKPHGGETLEFRGHHPDCERYQSHILIFKDKAYCAGCSGLAIGAILAFSITTLYSILGLGNIEAKLIFWSGAVLVTLGLIQHFIDLGISYVHLLLNVSLVSGVSMMIITIDSMSSGFFTRFYALAMTLFWISSRIRISQEEHFDICDSCHLECDTGFRTTIQ